MRGKPLELEGDLRDEIRLREDTVVELRDRAVVVHHRWGSVNLGERSPAVHAVLQGLITAGADGAELWRRVVAADEGGGPDALTAAYSQLLWALAQLEVAVQHRILDGGAPLLSIEPIAPSPSLPPGEVDEGRAVSLSRFALLRRRGDSLVLESPRATTRLVAHSPLVCLVLQALARPTTLAELGSTVAGVSPPVARLVVKILAASRMLGDADEDAADDPRGPALSLWEPYDLWFHTHSRIGFHDELLGAGYAHRSRMKPLPAVKERMSERWLALPVPEARRVLARDPSLTLALERRASIREYGTRPLTLEQVGELLFRSARARAQQGPMPEAGLPYESSDRPYPTGGAMYELELYLTVNRAEGLARGIYHYAADEHRLYWLHDREEHLRGLLGDAVRATGMPAPPDILITLTSRFQRMSWKYGSIAYATTLKNVGVLYQTMYLVATAMGLAPCALGSGNSVRAEQAFGLDGTRESSVGEFMVGSLPDQALGRLGARQHPTWRPLVEPDWV